MLKTSEHRFPRRFAALAMPYVKKYLAGNFVSATSLCFEYSWRIIMV